MSKTFLKCNCTIDRKTGQDKLVRVIMFSDTHGFHDCFPTSLPDADLLIFAGDMTQGGGKEEIIAFDEFLGKFDNIPNKVIIPGNHDKWLRNNPGHKFKNAICLVNESTVACGLKIYGTPFTEETPKIKNYKAYQEREMVIDKCFVDIPENLDILISHAPPFEILDSARKNKYDKNCKEFYNVGSKFIRKQIEERAPRVCLFGHVHEDFGYTQFKDFKTWFFNGSIISGRSSTFNKLEEQVNLPFYIEMFV